MIGAAFDTRHPLQPRPHPDAGQRAGELPPPTAQVDIDGGASVLRTGPAAGRMGRTG